MMLKKSFTVAVTVLALAVFAFAQNSNTNTNQSTTTRRTRTTTTNTTTATDASGQAGSSNTSSDTTTTRSTTNAGRGAGRTSARQTRAQRAAAASSAAAAKAVRETFDALIDGIRSADVDAVMNVYWNSPQLVLFNNNGTVTRTWEQVRRNRTDSYAKVQDVKLDVRDVRVQVLDPDAAVVTCLWTQSQTNEGRPESASGRLTLVFQKIEGAWRAVHAHTSPDRPDPSRLLPSERTTTTDSPTTTRP